MREHGACNAENWRLTSALPHLSSLDVSMSTAEWSLREAISQCLALLLARPQLTELVLRGTSSINGEIVLLPLLQSAGHLRALHLCCHFLWQARADAVAQFASLGAALPHLQELTMTNFKSSSVSVAEWRRLFSSLQALQTLRLNICWDLDALLPLLAQCAQLRHLRVEGGREVEQHKPSSQSVAALQGIMPQLRIEIAESDAI